MEAVGAVASLVALAPVALQTYSQAQRLYREIQNAPSQLAQLVEHLGILDCELSLLSDLGKRLITGNDFPLVGEETIQVEQALKSTHNVLRDISQNLLSFRKASVSKRDRINWIVKGKAEVEEQCKGLERANVALSAVLQLLNVMVGKLSRSQGHNTLLDVTLPQKLSAQRLNGLLKRNPQFQNILRSSWQTLSSSWLAWLGVHIIFTSYQNDLQTTSHLTVRIDPLPAQLSRWDIFIHLKLRVLLNNSGFQVLRGGLSCRNVIPEGSALINACKQGDVLTLRHLFSSRKASIHDVTPNNFDLMTYAIQGGSLEVVQFLHSVGANVNSPSGRFQSSPLEWAFNHRQLEIARFLLSCGAEIDYLCTRGWTPVQHLYWPSRTWRSGHSSTQFLSMLCAQSFSEFNTQDAAGAAAIHRAASWGTAEDVRSLLQVGASPSVRTPGRGWTPAFYAASCNNVGALRELAACQSGGFLEHLDNNGRTMLHVALETKSSDAVRFMLAQGADPHAVLPDKRWSDASTIIDDKHTQVSAAGLALQVGGETCTAFIQGLQDAGHDVTVSAQDDAEGLFWPAEEAL